MWSKWLCVNMIWLTGPPAISATSALTAFASVNVVPVSISNVPVSPYTRPTVTSRKADGTDERRHPAVPRRSSPVRSAPASAAELADTGRAPPVSGRR